MKLFTSSLEKNVAALERNGKITATNIDSAEFYDVFKKQYDAMIKHKGLLGRAGKQGHVLPKATLDEILQPFLRLPTGPRVTLDQATALLTNANQIAQNYAALADTPSSQLPAQVVGVITDAACTRTGMFGNALAARLRDAGMHGGDVASAIIQGNSAAFRGARR